jgi:hypothetical protein
MYRGTATTRGRTRSIREGLIVPPKRGIYANPPGNAAVPEDKVADFSYENDSLADLIVQCWGPGNTLAKLTTGPDNQRADAAKEELEARGIYLEFPFVVTEDEYEAGFSLEDHGLPHKNGVVFVVPRRDRVTIAAPTLLETAKMLMAITPNGI